jgi:heat shock protein HslJ
MKYLIGLCFLFVLINCSPRLAPDSNWGRQQWTVVEMKGVPVQQSGGRRDAHIVFDVAERKFRGNGGCNQISGNYSLSKKVIHFTEIIATKMSCEDIDFENVFLNELGRVDRYEINNDEMRLKREQKTLIVLRSK